ncbi:hypothetical protein ABT237_21010 [Streptomyces sp. NPDC001581]|uniref:hypothetical protein n=1 Tax=Streptomyces sp. NPDC001581 TaxID=3154386 RepID=UPI003322E627
MTKKLEIDAITSDLEGSAFFPQRKNPELSSRAPIRETPSVSDPVPVPPTNGFKRRIIRRRWPSGPFEDQVEALQRLSEIEKQQGLTGSMSAMVREALDLYLKSRPPLDK